MSLAARSILATRKMGKLMSDRILGFAMIAIAATLTLTACTAEPPVDAERVTSASPAPTTSDADLPTPDASAPVALVDDSGPCEAATPQRPAEASSVEQLGGQTLIVPFDRGPLPYAGGTANVDEQGVPVAYTAVADDNFESIATRFCVDPLYLDIINSVRRTPAFISPQALYAGDTVNLDAHTIFTVGDQNGTVHNNDFPDMVFPPQR